MFSMLSIFFVCIWSNPEPDLKWFINGVDYSGKKLESFTLHIVFIMKPLKQPFLLQPIGGHAQGWRQTALQIRVLSQRQNDDTRVLCGN